MNKFTKLFAITLFVILVCSIVVGVAFAQGIETNTKNSTNASYWQNTSNALGVTGIGLTDGSVCFVFPTTQNVTVDGIQLNDNTEGFNKFNFVPISAGILGGNNTSALMTGYILVPQTKLKNATMLINNAGFNITAINQHLPRTNPAMSWIHICASGDPVAMATSLKNISTTLNGQAPAASIQMFDNTSFNTNTLNTIMGMNSTVAGGDFMYVKPTNITATLNGITLGAADTCDAIQFQPVGKGTVAVSGEFVLTSSEVEPMVSAFLNNGIEVSDLHNHLVGEQPALYYLHTWAVGDPTTIATTISTVMNTTGTPLTTTTTNQTASQTNVTS